MKVVSARIESARCGTRPGLLLYCSDSAGRVGKGEATPLPGLSPESLEDARAVLSAFAVSLPRHVVSDPAGVDVLTEDLPTAVPSARFAIETALLDLVAQEEDVSIATLLRGGPAPHVVRHSALLIANDVGEALAEATRAFARGLRTFKRKLGGRPFPDELALQAQLRARFGAALEQRVDANGAWTPDEARTKLAALGEVGVALVEEPTSGVGLCALGPVAVPWAADESLRDAALASRLVVQPSCAAFVLKPMLLGGLSRCLALADLADRHGRDVIVTHMFDGAVALGACEALAAALPRHPLACGLDSAHLDRRDPIPAEPSPPQARA